MSTSIPFTTDAKRTKRTGLQYERYQPRPAERGLNVTDCAVRAACWATGEAYEDILKEMQERTDTFKTRPQDILKSGTPLIVIRRFMLARGWTWKPALGPFVTKEKNYGRYKSKITQRKNLLFKAENLPRKTCVAITTSHAVAVEDHVVLDSYDSRGDRSCVLEGYFVKECDS